MVYANIVVLIGNLTRDPELRYSQDGTPVCGLDIAMNKPPRADDPEKKTKTTFIKVTVWRKQAESCAQYLVKGSQVYVEGELKMNEWENKEGEKRSRIEVTAKSVQFLGGKRKDDQPAESVVGQENPEHNPEEEEQE